MRTISLPQLIINSLQEKLPSNYIASYKIGDPGEVKESELPAVYVTEIRTQISLGSTQHDEIVHTVMIQVVVDRKTMFGSEESLDEWMDKIVIGKNSGGYDTNCVLGILRRAFTLGGLMLDNQVNYEKDNFPRRNFGVTFEGILEMTLTEEVEVVDRA